MSTQAPPRPFGSQTPFPGGQPGQYPGMMPGGYMPGGAPANRHPAMRLLRPVDRFGRPISHAKAVRRWAGRRLLKALRSSWTYRRTLAPLYVMAYLAIAGSGLHILKDGVRTAVFAFTGLHIALFLAWLRYRGRKRWLPKDKRLIFAAAVPVVSSAWLVTCAAVGMIPPVRSSLVFGGLTVTVGWWWYHRRRFGTPFVPSDEAMTWEESVACQGGALPGSDLTAIEDIPAHDNGEPLGVRGIINLPKGKLTTSAAVSATEKIASAFGMNVTDIAIEATATGAADKALFARYTRNPLHEPHPWPGPQLLDPATGLAPIGVYSDGSPAYYRFWGDAGPVHDLIAGTTGSGKSRLLDQLLAYERWSPFITSVVIDPQRGQSLPDWRDAVARFATSAEEGLEVLLEMEREMHARNAYLADRAWTDTQGRARRGQPSFWPTEELPLISITIEEAHEVLANQQALRAAEAIAKMGRKCGLRLRLVVQVPLLSQLGGSMTLRSMVSAGNVVVFRTADGFSGQVAFQGSLPVDPKSLPREFPGGKSTAGVGYLLSGSSRPVPMRAYMVVDPYDFASTGSTTPLRSLQSVVPPSSVEALEARTTRERAVAFLVAHGRPAKTGAIHKAVSEGAENPVVLSAVTQALGRAVAAGEVIKTGHGVWAATKRSTAEAAAGEEA